MQRDPPRSLKQVRSGLRFPVGQQAVLTHCPAADRGQPKKDRGAAGTETRPFCQDRSGDERTLGGSTEPGPASSGASPPLIQAGAKTPAQKAQEQPHGCHPGWPGDIAEGVVPAERGRSARLPRPHIRPRSPQTERESRGSPRCLPRCPPSAVRREGTLFRARHRTGLMPRLSAPVCLLPAGHGSTSARCDAAELTGTTVVQGQSL